MLQSFWSKKHLQSVLQPTPTCKPLYLTALTQSLLLNLPFIDYKVNIKFMDWKFVINVILPDILWQTQPSAPRDIWQVGLAQLRSLASPPLNLIS